MVGEWYYHLYETPCANDMDYYDGMSGKLANGFPIPRNPNAKPVTLEAVDQALREIYMPGLLADINRPLLFDQLGFKPVQIIPSPRWRRTLRTARERLNSCYMHLRYGECDDLRDWMDNDD